jgi:hypothetical protein
MREPGMKRRSTGLSFWNRCGVELADGHETYRRIWLAQPNCYNLDYRTITARVDEDLGNNTR